jgi:hypothetical protein
VEGTLQKEYMQAHYDYARLTTPVLAFFADHQLDKLVADATNRSQAEQARNMAMTWQREQIQHFKTQAKQSQVVELADTDHFCFIQRQQETVRQMESFLEQR